jgi:hypothetical protein
MDREGAMQVRNASEQGSTRTLCARCHAMKAVGVARRAVCCHVEARGRVNPCSPIGGDDAVTKDAKKGFKAVYRCHSAQGVSRPKAPDPVMKVIHCLFLSLLTSGTFTAVTRVQIPPRKPNLFSDLQAISGPVPRTFWGHNSGIGLLAP